MILILTQGQPGSKGFPGMSGEKGSEVSLMFLNSLNIDQVNKIKLSEKVIIEGFFFFADIISTNFYVNIFQGEQGESGPVGKKGFIGQTVCILRRTCLPIKIVFFRSRITAPTLSIF